MLQEESVLMYPPAGRTFEGGRRRPGLRGLGGQGVAGNIDSLEDFRYRKQQQLTAFSSLGKGCCCCCCCL